MVGGDIPFYLKFCTKVAHPFKNGFCQSIQCAASAENVAKKLSYNRLSLSIYQYHTIEQCL